MRLSERAYNLLIGAILLYGFVMNAVMCIFFTEQISHINAFVLLIGYFVLCISGAAITKFSSNPWLSFLGYNMMVVPVGAVLSIVLSGYYTDVIMKTIFITAIVTVILMIAATINPNMFLSMGKVLFVSLFAVFIVEILLMLFGISTPTWIDAIVALIFCGYIGYDWAEAQRNPKTVDSAVDASTELYLDIINLFLRLLSIIGKKDD